MRNLLSIYQVYPKFDLLFQCVQAYLLYVPYKNDVTSKQLISFESKTQLLLTLVICRHGLDLAMMAFISDKCASTIQIMFISWVVFLATVFNQIDLRSHSHIKSFASQCQNYAKFQTNPPSTLNIKIPSLPKTNVYDFKYKTRAENIASKIFLSFPQCSSHFC